MTHQFVKYLSIIIFISSFHSQNLIINGSFEGVNSSSNTLPLDWSKCHTTAYPNTSTPDVMPGVWNVTNPPHSGSNYLNLVCTPIGNNISERAHGKLSEELIQGNCYQLNVWLMMSSQYYIQNDWVGVTSSFELPVGFHVGLSYDMCSPTFQHIKTWIHTDGFDVWKKYTYYFTAQDAYQGIRIYTTYYNGSNYHGHVLVDDISIIPIESLNLSLNDTIYIAENDSITINPYSSGSANYIQWNDTVLCVDCNSITFYYDSLPQHYSGILFDTTSCFSMAVNYVVLPYVPIIDSIGLFLDFIENYEIPNIVTPNEDGVNDIIKLPIWEGAESQAVVYNRWGNKFFETNRSFIDLGPLHLSDGVYFLNYYITFKGKTIQKTTFFHLNN